MRAKALILLLEDLVAEHGDLVVTFTTDSREGKEHELDGAVLRPTGSYHAENYWHPGISGRGGDEPVIHLSADRYIGY